MSTDLFTVMRSMDAADEITPDLARAATLRESILREPRVASIPVAALAEHRPQRRAGGEASHRSHGLLRGTRARLAAMGATAAAGVAAFTVVGGGSPAYAAWSATPQPLSAHDLRVAEAACEPELRGLDEIPSSYRSTVARPPLALSERRGDYVLLQYATNTGEDKVQTCLVTLEPGASKATDAGAAGGGSDKPMRVSSPNGIVEGGLSTQGEPPLSVLDGVVGANVRGVTVHAGDKKVIATVKNGMFTAVWPGDGFDGRHRKPVTFDVTLADGRVITDAHSV